MDRQNHPRNLTRSMWYNWTIAYGAITLPLVLSLFMSLTWLPFAALFEVYALATLRKSDRLSTLNRCSVLPRIAMRILLVSALIMIIINIMCTDWLIPTVWRLKVYNNEIPFIVCLIISPVTAFFCAMSLWAGLGAAPAANASDVMDFMQATAWPLPYTTARRAIRHLSFFVSLQSWER